MKHKFNGLLALLFVLITQITFAQDRTVSGTVTDKDGFPVAIANVKVKGTSTGTQTDIDGKYKIKANADQTLVFSYLGMKPQEVKASAITVNIKMAGNTQELDVVTVGMGIKKEKKSLGYSSQQVKGDDINDVPLINFADGLSGEVAGLDVQSFGTMGGSANINVRGMNSISGSNQTLIIIDGTPVINTTSNTNDATTGRGGYDYGNGAMDINPDNIATMNVLKGAAATAIYGSRGANGVILITTKKGKSKKGLGFSFNSATTIGTADKSTLPIYQDKYGAGYGKFYGTNEDEYFNDQFDINGDGTNDLSVPFTEDASYGAAFDPNLMIYQWTSIFPQLAGYRKATPWVAGRNNPNSFFVSGITSNNSLSYERANSKGNIRLGYNNQYQTGILENSSIKRNTINVAGAYTFFDKLTVSTDLSFTNTKGNGRYGSGYNSNNPMQQFRQWWQVNVDVQEQRDAYFSTGGQNITWNTNSHTNLAPIYSDNPYWTRYKNFQSDSRNRILGNLTLNYKLTSWFSLLGRATLDSYKEIREERTDIGSSSPSEYILFDQSVSETNYDLIGNFDKNLTTNLNLNGLVGFNLRTEKRDQLISTTNGGIRNPGVFNLENSVNPLVYLVDILPVNYTKKVDGVFGKIGLGYKGTYYIEGSARQDRSSSLPIQNNSYFYPSVNSSIVFSNLIKLPQINFGKIRASYGEVGNDTDPYQVFTTYGVGAPFNGQQQNSNGSFFNNLDLKSERSKDIEFGLEMSFLKNRFGFDISYYKRKTTDLITPIDVSTSTGATNLWLNGADLEKKGFEALINITPIKTKDFVWDIKLNYAENTNEVTRLSEGIQFIQLASVQGGITLGAALGEPLGVIRGRDYVYHANGEKIVQPNGRYLLTDSSNNVIGDINPDWRGGIKNTFGYKNIKMSFLIDIQKGGDVFSLDTWYGYATGLYDFTAGTNDLGNPVRNTIANGGGIVLPGVQANGSPNTVRSNTSNYANPWGYARAPQIAHVYDASFVKLRELTLNYQFSDKIVESLKLSNLSFSLIGRNLWIIDKNTPYTDPEAGLGAGNIQGYQSGAYPSVREIGCSLKLEF